MAILDALWQRTRSLAPSPTDRFWYSDPGVRTAAGVDVDEKNALTYSAAWAATRILCTTIASLPAITYQYRPAGGKVQATQHELFCTLRDCPNPEMDSFTFWESRSAHVINWGNGYSEIQRAKSGKILYLWPIHPSRIPARNIQRHNGRLVFLVNNNTAEPTPIQARDIYHTPGLLSEDGITGKGVIQHARESIGMGLATEKYGAAFFGNGGRPGGLLKHPGQLSEVAKKGLRESWAKLHGGPGNAHRVAVLAEGMDFVALDVPPEQAQFLLTRQFNITEIARWYGLPPHLLAELSKSSFSNIEQENMSFVIHSIRPWLVRIERSANRQLFTAEERKAYFMEFQLKALLRGDAKTRSEANSIRFRSGNITANEWREEEGDNPIPGGDRYYVSRDLAEVGETDAGDEVATATMDTPATDAVPTELLDVPDFRQTTDYDCGAAASHSVAAFHETGPKDPAEWITLLGTNPTDGTKVIDIIRVLNSLGLTTTTGNGMTVEDLAGFFAAGQPTICPVQMYGATLEYDAEEAENTTGHYVVVIGAALGHVFFQDPSSGRGMMTAEDFLKVWHDEDTNGEKYSQFGIAVGKGATMPTAIEAPLSDDSAATDGTAEAAAQSGDVQATALNGAQIVALMAIADKLVGEEYPADGAKALIRGAFPLMPESLVNEIVDALDRFEAPEKPAPVLPPGFGPQPPAELPEDDKPPEEDKPDGLQAQRDAVRGVLVDALQRMIRKECNALRRAAKDPSKFLAKLDAIFDDHERELLIAALSPGMSALAALRRSANEYDVMMPNLGKLAVNQMLGEAKEQLLTLAGECKPAELAARVNALCDCWEAARANEIAARIMGEQ